MKSKIAVLFLIGLLCLTMGCSNTSPITKEPASVSSSESKEVPDQAKSTQATERLEVQMLTGVQQSRQTKSLPCGKGQAFFPAKCSVRTAVQSSISVPPRALTPIRSITAAPTTKAAEETVRYTISAM